MRARCVGYKATGLGLRYRSPNSKQSLGSEFLFVAPRMYRSRSLTAGKSKMYLSSVLVSKDTIHPALTQCIEQDIGGLIHHYGGLE